MTDLLGALVGLFVTSFVAATGVIFAMWVWGVHL